MNGKTKKPTKSNMRSVAQARSEANIRRSAARFSASAFRRLSVMLLALVCVILPSCGELKYSDKTYTEENMDITYPYFEGDDCAALNETVRAALFDSDGVRNFLENEEHTAERTFVFDGESCVARSSLKLSYETPYINDGYVSIVFKGYLNILSAAHPSNIVITVNADIKTGETIDPLRELDGTDIDTLKLAASEQLGEDYYINAALAAMEKGIPSGSCGVYVPDGIRVYVPVFHALGDYVSFVVKR